MSPSNSPGRSPATWVAVTILLLAAIVGSLWVPIYARTTPMLGAFPFFYWYQLILVPAVAIVSWIAYLLLRPGTGGASSPDQGAGAGGGQEAQR